MAARSIWFRLDVDFDDSDWIVGLSESGQLAWVKFLAYVKREGRKGVIRVISVDRLASKFSMKPLGVKDMLAAAIDDGAIKIVDGQWHVVNWAIYQPMDYTAAKRQSELRERQEKAELDLLDDEPQRMRRPTLQEVKDEFRLKGSDDDEAESFYAYYDSKGWKVGKSPMKKWKASAAGWIVRNQKGTYVPKKKTGATSPENSSEIIKWKKNKQ
jgi:hypothetical protein